ncbi:MAG: hypothetical protein WCF18_14025 [Chthoniobacteraceae bacterium]
MKYLGLIVVVAIIYFVLARESPVDQVKEAIVQTEAAPLTQGGPAPVPTSASPLKQPLDRTHDVLEKVKARNGDGEF